jgi:hypothetical protein
MAPTTRTNLAMLGRQDTRSDLASLELTRDLRAAEPWNTFGPRPLEDFEICPSQRHSVEPVPVILSTGHPSHFL